jgi:hypothetical protein
MSGSERGGNPRRECQPRSRARGGSTDHFPWPGLALSSEQASSGLSGEARGLSILQILHGNNALLPRCLPTRSTECAWTGRRQHVRLVYRPPASSTFLSEQTSQQYFSLRTISTSRQPNEQAARRRVDSIGAFALPARPAGAGRAAESERQRVHSPYVALARGGPGPPAGLHDSGHQALCFRRRRRPLVWDNIIFHIYHICKS